MFRGLQSATSGMIAQQRRQDALSQNLANLNTPGYKNDQAVLRAFPQMLLSRIRDGAELAPVGGEVPRIPGQAIPIGTLQNGVYNQELIPNFNAGTLIESGNDWDFAIADQDLPREVVDGQEVKPSIFFAVQTPEGETRYTRNGKFSVDASGRLVTADGYMVLNPAGQPVRADENNKVQLTQIGLVRVNNPHQLVRDGNNAYRWTGQNPLPYLPAGDFNGFSVRQGFVEGSNVDPSQTMTDMMVTMRSYEANQKVIQAYDRTMELLSTVGRLG